MKAIESLLTGLEQNVTICGQLIVLLLFLLFLQSLGLLIQKILEFLFHTATMIQCCLKLFFQQENLSSYYTLLRTLHKVFWIMFCCLTIKPNIPVHALLARHQDSSCNLSKQLLLSRKWNSCYRWKFYIFWYFFLIFSSLVLLRVSKWLFFCHSFETLAAHCHFSWTPCQWHGMRSFLGASSMLWCITEIMFHR